MQGMQPHFLVKFFWAKLIRFGKFGLIWVKLKRNLSKIEAKFGLKLLDLGIFD